MATEPTGAVRCRCPTAVLLLPATAISCYLSQRHVLLRLSPPLSRKEVAVRLPLYLILASLLLPACMDHQPTGAVAADDVLDPATFDDVSASATAGPIVNAPVAPEAIYVGRRGNGPGLSVIDLNGF